MDAPPDRMRALVLGPAGRVALRVVQVPRRRGECLVRVTRAGICGTDLALRAGYAGFRGTPGHEFVGVVERASARDAHWLGRRVVGEINVGCGRCPTCRTGTPGHCARREVLGIRGRDGAFAEYLTLPATNLHEVPDGIPDDHAVFVEPLAAACRVLEQVPLDGSTRVTVLGDGRLGLLTAQVLRTTGSAVTVVGRHRRKLAVARRLGLHASTTPRAAAPCDVVVDCTGRAGGLPLALDLVRPRGVVVLKSTHDGVTPLATWPIVVREVTIVGSRCGPFDRALGLLTSGAVDVAPLLSGTYPLERHQKAFAAARAGLKVLFTPGDSPRPPRRARMSGRSSRGLRFSRAGRSGR